MDIYRKRIIDLYERPLNYGTLDSADFSYEEDNPLCGDMIRIEARLDGDGRVVEIAWQGEGCAISQAAASLLTEAIKGKSLADIDALSDDWLLEKMGIPLSMARRKCALLCLRVLQTGASGYTPAGPQ